MNNATQPTYGEGALGVPSSTAVVFDLEQNTDGQALNWQMPTIQGPNTDFQVLCLAFGGPASSSGKLALEGGGIVSLEGGGGGILLEGH